MCIWELIIRVLHRKGKDWDPQLYKSEYTSCITATLVMWSQPYAYFILSFHYGTLLFPLGKFWRSRFGPMGVRAIFKTSEFLCKKMFFLHLSSCRSKNVGVGHGSTLFFVQRREKVHPGAFGRWMCTGQFCPSRGTAARALCPLHNSCLFVVDFIIEGLNS